MSSRSLDPRLTAIVWVGFIYATIPFVRSVREALAARWPPELVGYGVMAVVIGTAAAAINYSRRWKPRVGFTDLVWLVGVAAAFVLWTGRLMARPEEAVHFLEYGVLGVLLYRAIEGRVPDATVYFAVILVGLLVGTVDEIIQWFVPGRFWDFRDIVLNAGAVALVQIAIWRLIPRPTGGIGSSSLRLLLRLAAIQVLLLTLCLAATPQRLTRLARHVPLPKRLATGIDAICEYGYRHTVDDRTVFRSRLTRDRLKASDRERAIEVAGELDASRGKGGVTRAAVTPVDDPFGYEVRVHVFARNRNFNRAREYEAGSPNHRRHMTSAWRENLILETFFTNTFELSSFRWKPPRRREVEASQDPDEFYVSGVGVHLITRMSEGRLRALMLVLLAALIAAELVVVTCSRPKSRPA